MFEVRWQLFLNSLKRIEWYDIGIALLIFIIFLIFRKIFTKYIFKIVLLLLKKTPTPLFSNLLLSFEKPLRVFWVVLGTYLALMYLPFHITTVEFVATVYKTIIIILAGWGIYNYTSEHSLSLVKIISKIEDDDDSMLIPFVSKILQGVVLALILLAVLSEWIDISGFIAGLGLGGLAFALAAQDTIGNFFGGVIIITEKPFKKGEWIQTPTVEGTVEDITFRSTRIRTFADSVVTIPNSTLANEPITNWSKMGKRRITFNLGVTYSTPKEKLKRCVQKIEQLLYGHEQVDKELIIVRFNEFNDSSLDIFIYFFTKSIVWVEWFETKEDINFKIMNILKEEGVSVAFPSRSIYVEKAEEENIE